MRNTKTHAKRLTHRYTDTHTHMLWAVQMNDCQAVAVCVIVRAGTMAASRKMQRIV